MYFAFGMYVCMISGGRKALARPALGGNLRQDIYIRLFISYKFFLE
jgi:hypothetical protein